MSNGDEDLRQDLLTAFDGDDPGTDFDDRVMADIEGGGGEHEISALPARPRVRSRWVLLLAATAAALLVALLTTGDPEPQDDGATTLATQGEQDGDDGEEPAPEGVEETPASDPAIQLPEAKTGKDPETSLRIVVKQNEKVLIDGKEYGWQALKEEMYNWVQGEIIRHADQEDQLAHDYPVLVVADKRVRWRVVQWVMQTCTDPAIRVWRLSFAVEHWDRTLAMPAHLPFDKGVEGREEKKTFTVELKRTRTEDVTRVCLLGAQLGKDKPGFDALWEGLGNLHATAPDSVATIHAWAYVPFQDVIRVMDILRQTGYRKIEFIGAPRPKPVKPPEEEVVEEPADGPKPINVPFWVRMLDGKPEIKAKRDREFEPFEDGLGVLIRFARWLKENGRDPTFVVHCEGDVPAAVKAKILAALKKEGVTKVELK